MSLTSINNCNSIFNKSNMNYSNNDPLYYYKFLPSDLVNGYIYNYGNKTSNKYDLSLNNLLNLNYYLNFNNQYTNKISVSLKKEITICFWSKFNTIINPSVIFNLPGTNDVNDTIICDISNNKLRLYNDYLNNYMNSNNTINNNIWNHIVCIITNDKWTIYINNTIDIQQNVGYNYTSFNNLLIGFDILKTQYYDGFITEFQIYDSILNTSKISEIYNFKNVPLPIQNITVTRVFNVTYSLYPTVTFTDVNDGSRKGDYILNIYNSLNILLNSYNVSNNNPIIITNYFTPSINTGYYVGIQVNNSKGTSTEVKTNIFYVVTGYGTFSGYDTSTNFLNIYNYTNFNINTSKTFSITNVVGSFSMTYFAVGGGGSSFSTTPNNDVTKTYSTAGYGGQCITNNVTITENINHLVTIGSRQSSVTQTSGNTELKTIISGSLINITASGMVNNGSGQQYQDVYYGSAGSNNNVGVNNGGSGVYVTTAESGIRVYVYSGASGSIGGADSYTTTTITNGTLYQANSFRRNTCTVSSTPQAGRTRGCGAGGTSVTNNSSDYIKQIYVNTVYGQNGVVIFTVNKYNIF